MARRQSPGAPLAVPPSGRAGSARSSVCDPGPQSSDCSTNAARARAAQRLTEQGVRPTTQRLRVLAELMDERNDATAQELHARLRARGERIGLATVYRTLSVLVDEGIADALSHHDGERCYRLCGTEHHHHLVCTGCHRVVELTDCGIGDWLERAAREQGFVATDHSLEVSGLCPACR